MKNIQFLGGGSSGPTPIPTGQYEPVADLIDLNFITTDPVGTVRFVISEEKEYRWNGTAWLALGEINFFLVSGTSYTAQDKDFVLTESTIGITTITLPPADKKWHITVKKNNLSNFSTFVFATTPNLIDGSIGVEIAHAYTTVVFSSDGLGNIYISS